MKQIMRVGSKGSRFKKIKAGGGVPRKEHIGSLD